MYNMAFAEYGLRLTGALHYLWLLLLLFNTDWSYNASVAITIIVGLTILFGAHIAFGIANAIRVVRNSVED